MLLCIIWIGRMDQHKSQRILLKSIWIARWSKCRKTLFWWYKWHFWAQTQQYVAFVRQPTIVSLDYSSKTHLKHFNSNCIYLLKIIDFWLQLILYSTQPISFYRKTRRHTQRERDRKRGNSTVSLSVHDVCSRWFGSWPQFFFRVAVDNACLVDMMFFKKEWKKQNGKIADKIVNNGFFSCFFYCFSHSITSEYISGLFAAKRQTLVIRSIPNINCFDPPGVSLAGGPLCLPVRIG